MKFKTLAAALLAASALVVAVPTGAHSETLRVLNGTSSSTLSIPMNRAVVVETDTPFAELSIANPGIADISTLSDRSIYVLGKAPGRTTLTILGADGSLFSNVDVQVTPDIAEFRERLRQILPNERIEVRTANDGIVLSGVVSTAARLDAAMELAQRYAPERVSNLMSVGGTQQVMLKVRFSEMNREVRKNLGISFQLNAGTHAQFSSGTLDGAGTGLLPGATGGREGALGFRVGGGSLTAQVLLEALEAQGMARTLAEPNLTALSGQEASFLAGGEVPVPVASTDGNIAVQYRPFGVELQFTPRVLDDNVINLTLNASVSSIDTALSGDGIGAGGIPARAFRTRATQTTVELRDGESFAIAGLLEDDFRANSSSVPWLSDIPILGALFRSSGYERRQTELVIIITAHLVTPTRGEALMLPTDRVRPPSERDLFLSGRLTSRNSGAEGEVARQDFGGSYGYVLD
ncbi:type II and III secretion system protein family protein [Roseinatronobacter alkalisoli]|uniref:Type II and III secretion system protein family protein n=1 Tax=Roseinatronobacter alkalisoli TaxID=3028235 RepID=A0ABT5TBI8_9RHOB|nr:type II and III secretion system protein family protein [Roseinatronobacter sp. HJB301]MDD7971746.1 type II and III secretion system protein family protein [Roseinatronobacter sp. HJB301]